MPAGFCLPATVFDGDPSVEAIEAAVAQAYALLGARCGDDEVAVAVRSSGIDEDAAASSFAGQHDTILDVRGARAVTAAVLAVRESAWSERVRAYRAGQGIIGDARIAVLVQQLVAADVSIVAFSVDPVRGDRDRIVVNASWGLGESIVSGSVTPDTYVIRRSDRTISERSIGSKARMIVAARDGARDVAVPTLLREGAALADHEIAAVAALVLDLESELGYPVDIEAAFSGGELHLLQCRPVTTPSWTVGR